MPFFTWFICKIPMRSKKYLRMFPRPFPTVESLHYTENIDNVWNNLRQSVISGSIPVNLSNRVWNKLKEFALSRNIKMPHTITDVAYVLNNISPKWKYSNSSPPWQKDRLFADDIFRCVFLHEQFCILAKISLKGPINNIAALIHIMA